MRFWTAMHDRFEDAGTPDSAGASDSADAAGFEVRRSFTDGEPGPGRGGLADWAQLITAGITVRQLSGGAASVTVEDLVDLGATMLNLFTSEKEDGVFEAVDSLGDGIIDVKSADPVDNTVPSGRSAAAEAVLLLAELGVEAAATGDSEPRGAERSGLGAALDTGRLMEVRDRLLGVYRALAGQAPRGCGHALWQAERALSPVRVATADDALRDIAAKHPSLTLLTTSTGVPGPDGREVEVPAGTAIVCRGTSCSLPVGAPAELEELLGR